MGDLNLFVLMTLCVVPAFYFVIEHRTGWKIFSILPPLLWIYATPLVLRALGILPESSPIYVGLKTYLLPFIITLMVMTIDIRGALHSVREALPLMLIGTLGVIIGCPIAYAIVGPWLDPLAWTGYGALAGSWIGGTANLAAVGVALETPPEQFGLAVLTDQVVFLAWLPLLILSRTFAGPFNGWTRARTLTSLYKVDASVPWGVPPRLDFLVSLAAAIANVWLATTLSKLLPVAPPFLSPSTWLILLVTTGAILLSLTPLQRSRQSETAGGALLYVFVATMGASATITALAQAPMFILGGFIWVAIHGAFILAGARWLRLDVHVAAIASAANIGGVASTPVVAAAHNPNLVPAGVLLAAFGNVIGNYGAIIAGHLCRLVAEARL